MRAVIIILALLVFFVWALMPENKKKTISFEDLEVGDILKIKGEKFTVVSYDENRNICLAKASGVEIMMQFPNDLKYVLHTKNNKRQFVEVFGFNRTITNSFDKIEIVS